MAEILLIRSFKIFVDLFCYFSIGLAVANEVLKEKVYGLFNISPIQNHLILMLSAVFLIVRIVWFVYDKFYLRNKEKKLQMKRENEFLKQLMETHLKDRNAEDNYNKNQ